MFDILMLYDDCLRTGESFGELLEESGNTLGERNSKVGRKDIEEEGIYQYAPVLWEEKRGPFRRGCYGDF
jgi:hypothetical protein